MTRFQRVITVVPVRVKQTSFEQGWLAALDGGFRVVAAPDVSFAPDVLAVDARQCRISAACRVVARLRKAFSAGLLLVVDAKDLLVFARRLPTVEFLAADASPDEIRARVSKAARHVFAPLPTSYSGGTQRRLGLHWRTQEISFGNRRVDLTLRELQLLDALLVTFPRIVSAIELAGLAWGSGINSGRARTSARVCSLRKKLAWFGADVGIRTVRGIGYALESRFPLAINQNRT